MRVRKLPSLKFQPAMSGHPFGVKPYGALLLMGGRKPLGFGELRLLGDENLLRILGYLPAKSLGRLATTCKALYCVSCHEELWKALVLQEFEGHFTFKQSWRRTYVSKLVTPEQLQGVRPRIFEGVYSDLLYQPYFCATSDVKQEWLARCNIDRKSGLTPEDFRQQYESRNQPVILTDVVGKWPAYQKWNRRYLQKAFGEEQAVVGDYSMKFSDFLSYADQNTDDMPLYLFDKTFAKTAPHLAADYEIPAIFAEDLFSVLGESQRPDHRWLIMGPPRSGSSFHKDPNSTSAWNAVVRGSKKWILFPPHVMPPGVHASEDGADVAAPVSLIEWFLNFYEQTEESPHVRECIAHAGDLLFVPRGWWHMALNLEESIAVTHNYVSAVNLPHVLKYLSSGSAELISGCSLEDRKTLYKRFEAALRECKPEVLQAAHERMMPSGGSKRKSGELSGLFQSDSDRPAKTGFKFCFGGRS